MLCLSPGRPATLVDLICDACDVTYDVNCDVTSGATCDVTSDVTSGVTCDVACNLACDVTCDVTCDMAYDVLCDEPSPVKTSLVSFTLASLHFMIWRRNCPCRLPSHMLRGMTARVTNSPMPAACQLSR